MQVTLSLSSWGCHFRFDLLEPQMHILYGLVNQKSYQHQIQMPQMVIKSESPIT